MNVSPLNKFDPRRFCRQVMEGWVTAVKGATIDPKIDQQVESIRHRRIRAFIQNHRSDASNQ